MTFLSFTRTWTRPSVMPASSLTISSQQWSVIQHLSPPLDTRTSTGLTRSMHRFVSRHSYTVSSLGISTRCGSSTRNHEAACLTGSQTSRRFSTPSSARGSRIPSSTMPTTRYSSHSERQRTRTARKCTEATASLPPSRR